MFLSHFFFNKAARSWMVVMLSFITITPYNLVPLSTSDLISQNPNPKSNWTAFSFPRMLIFVVFKPPTVVLFSNLLSLSSGNSLVSNFTQDHKYNLNFSWPNLQTLCPGSSSVAFLFFFFLIEGHPCSPETIPFGLLWDIILLVTCSFTYILTSSPRSCYRD